jgi:predicted DNA-binding protein
MKDKQTFCLREDQIESLNDLSKQTGAPKAELIRRAIDHYLVCPRRYENASKPAA